MRRLGVLFWLVSLQVAFAQAASTMVYVKGGTYAPFFRDKDEADHPIKDLLVDKFPVTNLDFKNFLKTHHEWRKSSRKEIFAGIGYLEHWEMESSFADWQRDKMRCARGCPTL